MNLNTLFSYTINNMTSFLFKLQNSPFKTINNLLSNSIIPLDLSLKKSNKTY